MAYEIGTVYRKDKAGNAIVEVENGARPVVLAKSSKRPFHIGDSYRFERHRQGRKVDFSKRYWRIPEVTLEEPIDLPDSIIIAGIEVKYDAGAVYFRLMRKNGKLRRIEQISVVQVLDDIKQHEANFEQIRDKISMIIEDCAEYLHRDDFQRRKIEAAKPHDVYEEGVRNTKRVLEQLL
jgi:hypothetical protein